MKRYLKWVPVGFVAVALFTFSLKASAQQLPDYDYVGIGGGDEGLVINGKITLDNNLSVRPSVATDFDYDDGDDVSYVLPVTYDFNSVDPNGKLYPFVGAGIGGDIGDDSTIEFALTAGSDFRFNDRWLANGSINYLPFADGDEVGFTLGIGYVW